MLFSQGLLKIPLQAVGLGMTRLVRAVGGAGRRAGGYGWAESQTDMGKVWSAGTNDNAIPSKYDQMKKAPRTTQSTHE